MARMKLIANLPKSLINFVDRVRDSFWAIPTGLLFSAGLLALLTLWLDTHPSLTTKFGHVVGMNIESISSIRTLLSTTAAAILGVAGVSFSITIASLTLASQQFGPRLIRNFIRNRFIQTVLGIFIATFFYCMLTMQLSTVFADDEYRPLISLITVLLLTLANLILLVLFIHHICVSIQVDSVINDVAEEMYFRADLIFSEDIDQSAQISSQQLHTLESTFTLDPTKLNANQDGYITFIHYERLLQWAEQHDATIKVVHRAGDYVFKGSELLLVSTDSIKEVDLSEIQGFVNINRTRTPEQDLEYTLRQLVEIALRALSPGINDPFTAMTCIDRLGSLINFVGHRPMPPQVLADSNGISRLLIDQTTYKSLVEASFNQLRQNTQGHVDVPIRLLETLTRLVELCQSESHATELSKQAELIMDGTKAENFLKHDTDALQERYSTYRSALAARSEFSNVLN